MLRLSQKYIYIYIYIYLFLVKSNAQIIARAAPILSYRVLVRTFAFPGSRANPLNRALVELHELLHDERPYGNRRLRRIDLIGWCMAFPSSLLWRRGQHCICIKDIHSLVEAHTLPLKPVPSVTYGRPRHVCQLEHRMTSISVTSTASNRGARTCA
jgi:hypothetical protein